MTRQILLALIVIVIQSQLPASFSWANQAGRNHLGAVFNQNNPHRCESGWAIATTNTLSARINIAMAKMGFASPKVSLSAQSLLECDTLDFGCLGGQPAQALRWIQRNNITDSSCNSYKAKGHTNGLTCSSKSRCQSCWLKDTCKGQVNSKIYSFGAPQAIAGEQGIAEQIMRSGPVVCGVAATQQFKAYKTGVFADTSKVVNHNHYVMVYGWGQDDKQGNYWLIQNTYGPAWGEEGTIRLLRGKNNLGIEASCYASTPIDTWTDDIRNDTLPGSSNPSFNVKIQAPFPTSIPLTTSLSQLNPNFCDSSWAFAVVHALADGELARSNGTSVRSFSVQALLNCGVGTCEKGGNPYDALTFINKYGFPEQGCQHYQAITPTRETCSAIDNCASCGGNSIFKQNCTEVKGYRRWKIYSYGSVSGASEMSRQLTNHHALICGIVNTQTFRDYTGGILSESTTLPKVDHWVQIVAEGTEGSTAYWLVRNSWGTSWGMGGFFKIKKGGDNLGIETKCYWAGDLS